MGFQHYTQDMSKIPLKYHINVLFYTKYTHPTLICRGTDARTDERTEKNYSIFRDKLLLLGEHGYQYRWKIWSVLSVLRTYKKYVIYSKSYTDTAIILSGSASGAELVESSQSNKIGCWRRLLLLSCIAENIGSFCTCIMMRLLRRGCIAMTIILLKNTRLFVYI